VKLFGRVYWLKFLSLKLKDKPLIISSNLGVIKFYPMFLSFIYRMRVIGRKDLICRKNRGLVDFQNMVIIRKAEN
jgi:hypothetical protein